MNLEQTLEGYRLPGVDLRLSGRNIRVKAGAAQLEQVMSANVPLGDLPPGYGLLQKPFTLGSLLNEVKTILAPDVGAAAHYQ